MRKISLLVLTLLLSTLVAYSQVGNTFTATTSEGVTLKYTVLTEPNGTTNGTVSVTRNSDSISSGSANDCGYTQTSLVIPSTVEGNNSKNYDVTKIGKYAFRECTSFTEVTIPNTVTTIEDRAFEKCSFLDTVTFTDGSQLTSIGNWCFYDCTNLNSITIPSTVTSIGWYAFQNCTALTNITIPNGVTEIRKNAFQNCTALTNITIPSTVTSIGQYAFYSCTALTNITIPNGVTEIKERTFKNCYSLSNITIPNGVTKIGVFAFEKCTSLATVVFATGSQLTSIENDAFYNCTSLKSITIPSGVTEIKQETFRACTSLSSVTMLGQVTMIGSQAFYGCKNLTNITCLATTPPTLHTTSTSNDEFPFKNITLNEITLNVPASAKSAYSTADIWNQMKIATPVMMKTNQWNFIAGTGKNVNVLNTNLPADFSIDASSYTNYSDANSTFDTAVDYKNCDIAALDFDYTTNNWNTTYLKVKDDNGNANTLTQGAGYFVWPFNENAKGTTITTANTITNLSNYLLTSGSVNLTTTANSGTESTAGNGYWYAFGNPFDKDLDVTTVLNTSHLSIGGSAVQGGKVYILGSDGNWVELSSGNIPAGQGFMVSSATQNQTATFNITYPTISKSATVKNATDNEGIKFVVTANGYSKPMYAKQISNAQDGFDINDAYILFSDDEQRVEPYFVVEGNAVKYNRYSSDVYECGVNFHALQNGEAKLSAMDVPNGTVVSIINLATDEESVLDENTEFTFNVEQGENAGKYKVKITKGALSIADVEQVSDVNVWNNKGDIHISGKDLQSVEVLNTLGQSIYMQQVGGNEYNFNLDREGSYIVRVKSQSGVKSQKLVITK